MSIMLRKTFPFQVWLTSSNCISDGYGEIDCELLDVKSNLPPEVQDTPNSHIWKRYTLPEANTAPKNDGFQQESPFPGVYCKGIC